MIDRRTHRCLLQLVRLDDDGDDGGDDDDGDDDGELARRSVHFIVVIVNGRIACDDAGITSQVHNTTLLGGNNPNLNPQNPNPRRLDIWDPFFGSSENGF